MSFDLQFFGQFWLLHWYAAWPKVELLVSFFMAWWDDIWPQNLLQLFFSANRVFILCSKKWFGCFLMFFFSCQFQVEPLLPLTQTYKILFFLLSSISLGGKFLFPIEKLFLCYFLSKVCILSPALCYWYPDDFQGYISACPSAMNKSPLYWYLFLSILFFMLLKFKYKILHINNQYPILSFKYLS